MQGAGELVIFVTVFRQNEEDFRNKLLLISFLSSGLFEFKLSLFHPHTNG